MDVVLRKLIGSWKELKLPVHSIQLDDWWYVGGSDTPLDAASDDHMCVKDLQGKKDLWPTGIPPIPQGMSYLLYVLLCVPIPQPLPRTVLPQH